MLEIIKIHYDPECSKSNIDMPVIAIVYRILVGLTQHSKSKILLCNGMQSGPVRRGSAGKEGHLARTSA